MNFFEKLSMKNNLYEFVCSLPRGALQAPRRFHGVRGLPPPLGRAPPRGYGVSLRHGVLQGSTGQQERALHPWV